MATNPLKTVKDIDKCIELLDKKIRFCDKCNKLYDHHPARIKKIENGYLKNFCIYENEYDETRF